MDAESQHVRQQIKRLLPGPLLGLARRIRDFLIGRRRSPLVTRYGGEDQSVLQGVIAYNKHGGYCVPRESSHRPAAQAILKGRVWESETIDFTTSNRGEGDIIHAGTYFGDFLPALSRGCRAGGKIWAFEPHPQNHRCAALTILINDIRNVELRNSGLGQTHGSFSMLVRDRAGSNLGGASRILTEAERGETAGTITVEVLAIDEVVPPDRRVSVIHLDVEGFEREVLTGALQTVRRCKPILILESLPDQDWLSENLTPLGYRLDGKVHANPILRPAAAELGRG